MWHCLGILSVAYTQANYIWCGVILILQHNLDGQPIPGPHFHHQMGPQTRWEWGCDPAEKEATAEAALYNEVIKLLSLNMPATLLSSLHDRSTVIAQHIPTFMRHTNISTNRNRQPSFLTHMLTSLPSQHTRMHPHMHAHKQETETQMHCCAYLHLTSV